MRLTNVSGGGVSRAPSARESLALSWLGGNLEIWGLGNW